MNKALMNKRQWLFALLMGAIMTLILTAALSLLNREPSLPFLLQWMRSFLLAWLIATPLIRFLAGPLRAWVERTVTG
ncbi:MAG: DUF2798 domain-containing protein [Pseudomonadaceae bacterium]|nr:MAG: DUF2798 domain-containing protein [Pseudomonadaceae bacterium]